MKNSHFFMFFCLALTGGYSKANSLLTCPKEGEVVNLEKWREDAIQTQLRGEYALVKKGLADCFPQGAPTCLKALAEYNSVKQFPHDADTAEGVFEDTGPNFGAPVRIGYGGHTVQHQYVLKSTDDLPKEFVPKKDFVKFPENILEVAEKNGWKAVGYKTRSTGGFDKPPNLSIVAIPGRDRDIYLQISPPPPKDVRSTKDESQVDKKQFSHGQDVLTIISVDKTKKPPLGELKLFKFDKEQGAYRWQTDATFTRQCIECHSTPLRLLSPRGYRVTNGGEKRLSPEEEAKITEINEMMLIEGVSWGHSKVDGRTVPRGPNLDSFPLGWAPPLSETRKEQFLRDCANKSGPSGLSYAGLDNNYFVAFKPSKFPPEINFSKLAQAMNCTQCHNNSARGVLHSKFSMQEIKFKILVDRSMPPGADLNIDERIALFNCLESEISILTPQWQAKGDWMRKEDCNLASRPVNKRPPSPTRAIVDDATK